MAITKIRGAGWPVSAAIQGIEIGTYPVRPEYLHPYLVAQYQNIRAMHWAEENRESYPQENANLSPAGVNWRARRMPRRNVHPDATIEANSHPLSAYLAKPYGCMNAGLVTTPEGVYR